MPKSISKRKAPRAKPKANPDNVKPLANDFPLSKLPPELREKVWEECLTLTRRPAIKKTVGAVKGFGRASESIFCEFTASPIASVCREARAVVQRLQRRGCEDAFMKRERLVAVLLELSGAKRNTPLASLIERRDSTVVLDLETMVYINPGALSLARGPGKHGARIIELLLAARDKQIKILSQRYEVFKIPVETRKI